MTPACVVVVLVSLAVAAFGGPLSVEVSPEFLFNEFVAKYEKVYESDEEQSLRFQIFSENLAKIEKMNQNEPFRPFGINAFSDLSAEEFRAGYLMAKGRAVNPERDSVRVADYTFAEGLRIPSAFDWRNVNNSVTPVKNQGQCGSCWAFSATENIESVWAIQGKHDIIRLAPQQIVDCDKVDAGCNGGDTPTAYKYVMGAGGLETESDYPYTAQDGKCKADKSKEVADVDGFEYATKTKNETEMLIYTYNKAPISICVDAETWQYYNQGVVTKNCGTSLDHCVQITGFGTATITEGTVNYWSVRNSWGASWGEEGFIRVERDKNLCGIANEATSTYIN